MNATTLPILDLARYADPADKAAFLADLRMKFSASLNAFLLSMRRRNSRWR